MIQVQFNCIKSYDDLGIILNSKLIGAPDIKTKTVDIPGADGVIDFTDYFGETKYKNRNLSFDFTIIGNNSYQIQTYAQIKNLLHGKKMKISFEEGFYYIGRLAVDDLKQTKALGTFSIDCDCEPYKYKTYKTIITNQITNSGTLIYTNIRKSVVPKITLSAASQLTFNDTIYSLSAGTYTIDDIVFKAGNNVMTITGNTTITVEYQEGSL